MADIVCVRSVWNHTGLPAPRLPGVRLHELHYGPEPGYPFGRRGLALATAWQQLGAGADGMLVLDADVAIDPCDMAAMLKAVRERPEDIHVAPVKLWPASTMRDGWVWGHDPPGAPTRWTFSFTYLPKALLEGRNLRGWTFPAVDTRLAEQAVRMGIPVRVVADCHPKHMHY